MPLTTVQPWLPADASPAPRKAGGWQARLELEFQGRGAESVLVGRKHYGPLRVQRPFLEASGACQAYILHPPGGVVGGDTLDVDVRVRNRARALVTTPGATKFYRSAGATACQNQRIQVDAASSVEWLPQETIVFAGALAESNTTIELAAGACGIGWEITCLGRPAAGERFDRGSFRQRLQWRAGSRPLLTEAVLCQGNDEALAAGWGFQGMSTFGTMVVHPTTHAALAIAKQSAAQELLPPDRFGASQLLQSEQQSTLVCRYLGSSAQRCKTVFTRIWQQLRPLVVGIEAEIPRVWRT